MLALPALRRPLLARLQRAVLAAERRWDARLAHAERLVQEARYEEAVSYLTALDRSFPATNVRAGRDQERERILYLLALSHEHLGHRRLALATYGRLAEFDPRNYESRFVEASAWSRLAGGWTMPIEARDAFARVLLLNPNHLPSVRGVMVYHMDRGEFREVVRAWESYLDAFLVQGLVVALGDSSARMNTLVDGEPHEILVPIARPAGWSGALRIETGGYALALLDATIVSPPVVGRPGPGDSLSLDVAGWRTTGMTIDGPGRYRPDSVTAALHTDVPPIPHGVALLRLRLRLFKPVDPGTWTMARKSYANTLNGAGLAASQRRLVLLPSAALADSVKPVTE